MTLAEFEREVITVATASPICGIPTIRRLTVSSINLRIRVTTGGFIDAFFNEQTGTTAFALIHEGQRIFGADNTGNWHVHPFADPNRHEASAGPISFAQIVDEIERHAP